VSMTLDEFREKTKNLDGKCILIRSDREYDEEEVEGITTLHLNKLPKKGRDIFDIFYRKEYKEATEVNEINGILIM
jgi:hypothetical protein